jgi:hypothetical protein
MKQYPGPVNQQGVYFDGLKHSINSSLVMADALLDGPYELLLDGKYQCYDNGSELDCKDEGPYSNCTGTVQAESNITCHRIIDVNISCMPNAPKPQNTNEESALYTLTRSPELVVEDYWPKEESGRDAELGVFVSSRSSCDYTGSSLSLRPLQTEDGLNHTVMLAGMEKGTSIYYVSCIDDFGNRAAKEISFYVTE